MRTIKHVSLLVASYDAAIEFYTKKLGFAIIEDIPFGEKRWVTIGPAGGGVTLALQQVSAPDDLAIVGRQGGDAPFLAIDTSDCLADYRAMHARGVVFRGEPESGPWGIGVMLEDLYGNTIFISQEAESVTHA